MWPYFEVLDQSGVCFNQERVSNVIKEISLNLKCPLEPNIVIIDCFSPVEYFSRKNIK